MTAILVRFEWHGDAQRSGTGPALLYPPLLAAKRRSVQQGHSVPLLRDV